MIRAGRHGGHGVLADPDRHRILDLSRARERAVGELVDAPGVSQPAVFKHLAAWFPAVIEGERVAGAVLRFVMPQDGAPDTEGEMLVYDPRARSSTAGAGRRCASNSGPW